MMLNSAPRQADDNHVTSPALDRRRFVAVGVSAIGAAVGTRAVGTRTGAVAEPSTFWRLNHAWGFPMGPKGSTSCDCTACRLHGENKIFFDRAAAETTRSHVGCRCIAEPIQLHVDTESLFRLSRDGHSVDRRSSDVAALLARKRLLT